MTALAELAAKQAITEQIYRYCRGIDRMDLDLALSVWHSDGVVDFTDGIAVSNYPPGPPPVPVHRHFEWAWPFRKTFLSHSHQATNILITVDGDRAASETTSITVLQKAGESGTIDQEVFWGRWLDRWSKRDGRWAVDYRRAITDCRFATSWAARPVDDPAPRAARRDRSDPSYWFFDLSLGTDSIVEASRQSARGGAQ
ncbi:MAG: nuclear transport factor 2 family protein [Caulobacterales bacterium]